MAHEPSEDEDDALTRGLRPEHLRYAWVRFALLRVLGMVYVAAFASCAWQVIPLLGSDGLLPASDLLEARAELGDGPLDAPTLFWLDASDAALSGAAILGLVCALAVALGATSAWLMMALWALQLSFTHVGQELWAYGWELLLLEAGFLAIFLCPLRGLSPFPRHHEAPVMVLVLYRWLLLRVMLGAGLIKLRGDDCWRALSCLESHYETQPLPSPLSWLWDALPAPLLSGGVVVNHIVELVLPLGLFGPRRLRVICGLGTLLFQVSLVVSGNLSFLNWLTIAIGIACLDDAQLERLIPVRWRALAPLRYEPPPRSRRWAHAALALVVALLSIEPVINMLSPDQRMNAGFDPLRLVNTYGAFGSVRRTRHELIIEGTRDEDPDAATWAAYALPCQPSAPERAPCFIAPLQPRLDWQIWFASQRSPENEPWLVHLVWQLTSGDPDVLRLFDHSPFSAEAPPRFIRIRRFRYRMLHGEAAWWERDEPEIWMRPISRDDPALLEYVDAFGWAD